jgi:hypothetical protein
MHLKTAITLAALLLATPVLAADQTRQQDRVRDPSTHVDGSTATQQRDRTRDRLMDATREQSRERSRAMSGSASRAGSGPGTGSGAGFRGGR